MWPNYLSLSNCCLKYLKFLDPILVSKIMDLTAIDLFSQLIWSHYCYFFNEA